MKKLNGEQRATLSACADDLKDLAGLSRKIETGWANPTEERRTSEIASTLLPKLSACAEILRGAAE